MQEATDLLTVPEVAQRLRLSTWRVYQLTAARELTAIRIGKSIRFAASTVEEFLRERVD